MNVTERKLTKEGSREQWTHLLNENRIRESTTKQYKDHRNGFDKDYDRIISSSSLRRLQDKAQVFPLQQNDFTRTRLTHSMEVSALGRSLGKRVAHELVERELIDVQQAEKIPALVEVACLVHDIGNPPFGHFGEDVIQKWFRKWFCSYEYTQLKKKLRSEGKESLCPHQEMDFMHFEGNAQALRILTKLQFLNDHYGANFTYGSLACILKYPYSSSEGNQKGGEKKSKEKFGYFHSERAVFEKIINQTVGRAMRHPLTFLMEAADDIAYAAADIEDGVKKGVVDWEQVYDEIKSTLKEEYRDEFEKLEIYRKKAIDNKVPDKHLVGVQNFRVWVQGEMIRQVVNVFIEKYDEIMAGEFDRELLAESTASDLLKVLKKAARTYVYTCPEVLKLELLGESVLSGLLDLFVPAVAFNETSSHKKLYHLISPNFRHVHRLNQEGKEKTDDEITLYEKLLLVTDFVSGMTDSYAVDLYQRLSGVKLY